MIRCNIQGAILGAAMLLGGIGMTQASGVCAPGNNIADIEKVVKERGLKQVVLSDEMFEAAKRALADLGAPLELGVDRVIFIIDGPNAYSVEVAGDCVKNMETMPAEIVPLLIEAIKRKMGENV